jgi:crotonobetainyl-CoA hydratase
VIPPGEPNNGPVVLTKHGPVAVIRINPPEALNAVDERVSAAFGRALTEVEGGAELRVCVVTGTGRAFCAGADLKNLARGGSFLDPEHPEWGFAGMTQRFTVVPLIAAINGFALGGGAEIVLACDLAVMSSAATMGLPEVTRGLIAGAGGLLRLPDQVPPKIAAHAVLSGEPIGAKAALQWGLVNSVVNPEDVVTEALRLAAVIAANAPLAVSASKRVMARRRDFGSDWSSSAWAMNASELDAIMASRDALEGASAFAETAPRASSVLDLSADRYHQC